GKVFIGSASDAPKVHSPQGQEDVDAQDSPSSAEEKLPVARNGAEIALRFQVDPQTHQVTVFVLDKTHRHVIRTIPPEEMARLRAGEIIDLFV
ncbi:MAG: flagellar protein FlaG, partial [Thermanaerothrix sp.]|nr:flagellar protein FlaG [Thermanaerothrix sp.]